MNHFNNLSPAQAERLALLLEELGEAQQAVGKILRHGYESSHPNIPERNNRHDLEKEIGHINLAVNMLVQSGDLISHTQIAIYANAKRMSIRKYLHHQS